MSKIVNGINIQNFISGWWGEHDEGLNVLSSIGLPTDTIPFDIEKFLATGKCIIIIGGTEAHISIDKQDNCFEFSYKCLNEKRSFKLFREWDGTDIDVIIKMESYSLGECVRQILIGKNIL